MAGEVEPARGGHGLQLMVRQHPAEMPPRRSQRIQEHVFGIIHLIHSEHRPQAPLVEARIVRHQRQPFDEGLNHFPDIRKHRRIIRIPRSQPMHTLAEPRIILRLRMDQTVESIDNAAPAHNDHPNAAHARRTLIRRLEIYCRKVSHTSRKDTNSIKQSEQPGRGLLRKMKDTYNPQSKGSAVSFGALGTLTKYVNPVIASNSETLIISFLVTT